MPNKLATFANDIWSAVELRAEIRDITLYLVYNLYSLSHHATHSNNKQNPINFLFSRGINSLIYSNILEITTGKYLLRATNSTCWPTSENIKEVGGRNCFETSSGGDYTLKTRLFLYGKSFIGESVSTREEGGGVTDKSCDFKYQSQLLVS